MSDYPDGLYFCVNNWNGTFCITNSIELCVSLGLFLFLIHDFAVRFNKQRQINFFFIVYIEMSIALIGNMAYIIDKQIVAFQFLELYAYDMYFTTIVYQVSRRIIRVIQGTKYFKLIWYGTHGTLIFFIIFLTVSFIVRNILYGNSCNEVWFFIINIIEILLSISMVIAGRWHNKLQQEKIQGMIQKNIKNPLPEVWKWIIINIICQVTRFTRSFIYILSPQNCNFTYDYTANEVLGFFFDIFGFHVGMIATIYFFRKRQQEDSFSFSQFQTTIRERIGSGYSKQIQMQSTTDKKQKIENLVHVKQINLAEDQRLTEQIAFGLRNSQRSTLLQKTGNFSI